jgi:hypothetical protein
MNASICSGSQIFSVIRVIDALEPFQVVRGDPAVVDGPRQHGADC